MKKTQTAWDERIAKERPAARTQPKYPWQVQPSIDDKKQEDSNLSLEVENDYFDPNPTLKDQFDLKNDQPDLDQKLSNITLSQYNPVVTQPGHGDPVVIQPSRNTTQLENEVKEIELGYNTTPLQYDPVGNYKTPNLLDDVICPTLSVIEQSVLRRLFRLSYGFNRQITDSVGIAKLAEKCNLGETSIKSALKSLKQKELIDIIFDTSGNPKGGNKYIVLQKHLANWDVIRPGHKTTPLQDDYITSDDHDFKQNKDHQSETMMIYKKLTGNNWTKNDQTSYSKIKHLSISEISQLIKSTLEKAHQKPASLAYFVKAYQTPTQVNHANKQVIKAKLAAIVQRKQEAHVGAKYTIADLTYDVKGECVREGIPFDHDIFNEILARKQG